MSQRPSSAALSRVAVLVDFDNVQMCARQYGRYELSFPRLRDFVRNFGQVVFVDVFLSPVSTTEQNVAMLWQAGFTPVACPLEMKDRDSVDSQIKARGRQYALFVDQIVVVSEDTDFSLDPNFTHYIRDLGKEVSFIRVSEKRDQLAGSNPVRELNFSRKTESWLYILDKIENGAPIEESEGRERALVGAVFAALRQSPQPCFFRVLHQRVCDYLSGRKFGHKSEDVRRLLTAMVDRKLIVKNELASSKVYSLNLAHPLVSGKPVSAVQPAAVSLPPIAPEPPQVEAVPDTLPPAHEAVSKLTQLESQNPGPRARPTGVVLRDSSGVRNPEEVH